MVIGEKEFVTRSVTLTWLNSTLDCRSRVRAPGLGSFTPFTIPLSSYYSFHCEHSVGYYCSMCTHARTHTRTHARTHTHYHSLPHPNRTPEEELRGVGRNSSQLGPVFPGLPPCPLSSATSKAAISTTLTSASGSPILLIWR